MRGTLNLTSILKDFFTDFTEDTSNEQQLGGKLAFTFGFVFVKGSLSKSFDNQVKTKSKRHIISSTMRIERYYSSVKEERSPLANDALTLLKAEDYVGFFQACGPTYTRGIRRAQEVTSIFQFNSSSREEAKKFSASIKVKVWFLFGSKSLDTAFSRSSKFRNESKSLKIKIRGYGLGLNQNGSETLVATNMQEHERVMKFAFNAMTRNEDAYHIGMVYGIEVVPWVNNAAFQVAAKLHDTEIILPLPRTLIPKAFMKDQNVTPVDFNNSTRSFFKCKDDSFAIDKFGYCCEPEALYDRISDEYDQNNSWDRICKPVRQLDRSLIKDNMVNNGEFIARLGSAMRYKLTQISVTEKCISAARAIPPRFDFNILKPQDSVKYDGVIDSKRMTLYDLKTTLDPLGDYSIIKHLTKELDEWIEMFYSPCFAALYGTNIDDTPDLDIAFFMAYPWHAHEDCMRLSCLTNNMRWDRENGGCVPSLIVGPAAPGYDDGKDTHCSSNLEKAGNQEECKYKQEDLQEYHGKVTKCWNNNAIIGGGSIDYYIEYFCMPQITEEKVSDETKQTMIDVKDSTCVV